LGVEASLVCRRGWSKYIFAFELSLKTVEDNWQSNDQNLDLMMDEIMGQERIVSG